MGTGLHFGRLGHLRAQRRQRRGVHHRTGHCPAESRQSCGGVDRHQGDPDAWWAFPRQNRTGEERRGEEEHSWDDVGGERSVNNGDRKRVPRSPNVHVCKLQKGVVISCHLFLAIFIAGARWMCENYWNQGSWPELCHAHTSDTHTSGHAAKG